MSYNKAMFGGAAMLALATTAFAGPEDNSLVWSTDREANVPFAWWDVSSEMVAMMHHVYDTLVYRNPRTMVYEPLLATGWNWIDDTTLEMSLREDVTFHDGTSFEAKDVVSTFSNLIDPETGVINARLVNWISGVEEVDTYTVRILMDKPFPPALEFLAGARLAVVPSESWEGLPKSPDGMTDFSQMPTVGTGPYIMSSFDPGEGMSITRNADYFDGPKGQGHIETVTLRTIPDQETRVAELMVGGIDWISDLPPDIAGDLGGFPGVEVVDGPDMRIAYLSLDRTGRKTGTPVADLKVRQAIAHAIDRETISKEIVGPASQVINSACYPTQVGCTDEVQTYDYDPDKARALLAEAGYPNGVEIDLGAYRERPHSEAIIGYLREVGITANLVYLQASGLREKLSNGELAAAVRTWASSGLNDISAFASVLLAMPPDDLCQSPEIMASMGIGDSTIDPEKRQEAYKEALVMVANEVCFVPLFSYSKAYGLHEDLDFFPTADGFPLFYMASWKQ